MKLARAEWNRLTRLGGELCREAGVLFAVFGSLEHRRGDPDGWLVTGAIAGFGLLLIASGTILDLAHGRRSRFRKAET